MTEPVSNIVRMPLQFASGVEPMLTIKRPPKLSACMSGFCDAP